MIDEAFCVNWSYALQAPRWAIALSIALGVGAGSGPALAQRAAENAIASADDAFGSTVGTEKSGIYNDMEVRGFNPVRAGNLRIEGVYFDEQGGLTGRDRAGSRVRVGIAALDYPFPAPSGIVDYQLRPSGELLLRFYVAEVNDPPTGSLPRVGVYFFSSQVRKYA